MRVDILSPRLLPYALTLGFLGAGALAGLVVATGNLVMIALVIGGLTGLLLLNALPLTVWILMIGVFLINGPVGYFLPGLSKIAWLFSLLGVFMSGAALLYAAAGRERPARPVPAFVHLALAFAVLAAAVALSSDGPMSEISSGAKRQFQFWGVIFLFALVPFSPVQVRRWLVFLLGVALIQLPFALYQRIKLVPQVMGFEQPGFVPFDIVVGSFEGSMFGGGASSIMAMYLVMASVGLFCAYREGLIGTGRFFLLLALSLLPLGLGETKVVLLLIPVVLFFAFHDAVVKRPIAFLGTTVVMLIVIAFLAYVYFMVQVAGTANWQDSIRDTFAYNFGEKGYYGTGVNRLTAIPYWVESQSWANPLRTLFGYGVGSSYGVDGRVPQVGHIFEAHSGMHIDLLTASLMLWDFGVVGTLLFLATLLGATVAAGRCLREAVTPWDRTLCRVLLGGLGASFLMVFYSSSIVVLVSHSFILALNLGLVAWRVRHGPLADPAGATPRGFFRKRAPAKAARFPRPPFAFDPGSFAGAGSTAREASPVGYQDAPVAGVSAARRRPQGPGGAPERPPPADLGGVVEGYQRRRGGDHPARPTARDNLGRIEPVIDAGQSTSH